MDKHSALKTYFGYDAFRPGQEAIVDALLSGRDAVGIMPTGAGKSICYQLPALLLEGLVIVVSPLISLMKDQVTALNQAGIPSAFINSSLSAAQYREALARVRRGEYKLLFVAPERLPSQDFLALCRSLKISLVAVDEAHCVSQWGQDFRPGYLKIVDFVEGLPARPPVGAFTATATEYVRRDIAQLLNLREPLCVTTGFDRPNLFFRVARPKNKDAYLKDYLLRRPNQSGIVYCATRKAVEAVCGSLRDQGLSATRYHAGLSPDERRENQDDFVYDRAPVMVATNAFGMGIDKSNVSFVVHYNMPKNPESYYQEAGRAGRDGQPADCTLLFAAADVNTARFLIQNAGDGAELDPAAQRARLKLELERLGRMVDYCKTTECLRGAILDYFGQLHGGACGCCGNCTSEMVKIDITEDAQKILSAVARIERRLSSSLGAAAVVRMLRGGRDRRTTELGLHELPTYGIMRDTPRDTVRDMIDHLTRMGYLALSADEYAVVRLTPAAKEVLAGRRRVSISVPEPSKSERLEPVKISRKSAASSGPLFDALRALRTRLAREESVPAYMIFSNATLTDMADKKPTTQAAFLEVSGVGEVKSKKYGRLFIDAVMRYLEGERAEAE